MPQGLDAVGWRIAVYWEDDREFYHGEVVSYDGLTGKYTVLYTDGASLLLLCEMPFCW